MNLKRKTKSVAGRQTKREKTVTIVGKLIVGEKRREISRNSHHSL